MPSKARGPRKLRISRRASSTIFIVHLCHGNARVTQHLYKEKYFSSRYAPIEQRDHVWKSICGHLQRHVPLSGVVLDLGAGYCSFINNIGAAEKHALDIFPGFSKFAAADVEARVGDCGDLSAYAAEKFDVVFASNLLEHLTREATHDLLQEVRRVLKPAGRLILLQPNFRHAFRSYFDDYTHVQIFTHVGLADLLTLERLPRGKSGAAVSSAVVQKPFADVGMARETLFAFAVPPVRRPDAVARRRRGHKTA